jgi:uncharacterized membrane protein YedE/YeeE
MLRRSTVLIWFTMTMAYAYLYVHNRITWPAAAGYEKDWTFQLTMFGIVRFPLLVAILAVVLWLEKRGARGSHAP